jgi:hypothetical protein
LSNPEGNRIDGTLLAAALISGIHRVISQQELLNRINVFPVADGDTGTNLSLSLGAALPVLNKPEEQHMGTMLAAVADAVLDGARGNSGAIIAQFFQGMSDSAGELTAFTTRSFGEAVKTGSKYAYDALSKPRQGTILSVMTAFAVSVAEQSARAGEQQFTKVMQRAVLHAEKALADTPKHLDVLRKAGVVDAGAMGFTELVAGMSEYLDSGKIMKLPDMSVLPDIEPAIDSFDNASQFRFCTECIVTGTDIDRRKLREALAILGDSIVLAGTKRKAKIHIHVDDPDTVFAAARQHGAVSAEKADDMHRQQHSTRERSRRFAVITDSAADILDEDIERLDIHMVPCRIQFGDRGYLDKVSITTEEFFAELKNSPHHPTTSQPAPGDFRRQFQFLASHFSDVLSINLTSAASGTFEGARSAAKRTRAAGHIHIIDSRNASMGQGQLVVLAAECAHAGIDIDTTIAAINKQIPHVRTFALLKDLRYAVRGGRLPQWVKSVADLLRMTPIVCTDPDGRIALAGFLFGQRIRIAKFARFVARRVPSGPTEVGIGHAVCRADAEEMANELRTRIPDIRKLTVCGLGTGLGVHGGPGTMIISVRPYLSAKDIS